jgi:serine/threonine-protein kinase SRPK3
MAPWAVLDSCLMLVDLKLDNILIGFENDTVLGDFLQWQALNPMARKVKDGRVIYQSIEDFGILRPGRSIQKIIDFGAALRECDPPYNLFPIQSDYHRSPEVILGAGWSCSADIWNLGVLVSPS